MTTESLPDCLPECKAARDERNAILSNDDDFRRRRSGPGVYYADGLGEVQAGAGAARQLLPPQTMPKGSQTDKGDGKGSVWVEKDPAIELSTNSTRGFRRIHRLGGGTDWNLRPFGSAPADALAPLLDGTMVPAVETRVDPALGRASYNPKNLPVGRIVFAQHSFRWERGMLWEKPVYWLDNAVAKEFGARGAAEFVHANKMVFWTGGQSSDQVALTWNPRSRTLKCLCYAGNSTQVFTCGEPDLLVPNEWITIEVLIADQYVAPVNDNKTRPSVPGPLGYPRFVAIWGARYGEKPQLLGYTNKQHPDKRGPAAIPSRWNDDHNPILKWQDANLDDYGVFGGRVVQVLSARQFDVVRDTRARNLKSIGGIADTTRYHSRKNYHWNPGRLPNWARGLPLAFCGGTLSNAIFVPKHPILGRDLTTAEIETYKQFVVASSDFTGEYVDGVEVHRITLTADAPVAPSIGDAVQIATSFPNYMGVERSLPGFPENRYYYAEPTFSSQWIDFPHQPGIRGAEDWVE